MANKFKVKDLLLQVALKTPEDVVYDRTGAPVSFDNAEGVKVTLTRVPTKAEAEAEAKKNPLTEALRRYGKAIGLDAEFADATVDGHQGVFVVMPARQEGKTDALIRAIMEDNSIMSGMPFHTGGYVDGSRRTLTPRSTVVKKPIADRAPGELSRAGWDFVQKGYSHLAGTQVSIVGQHYRPKLDQETLLGKRQGHMVLLVAEPDNGHDLNGVMVLVWNQTESQWRHVGYVPREQAAELRAKWPDDDLSRVVVGHITSVPANADGRRGGRNISVLLSGQTRKYPAYRA